MQPIRQQKGALRSTPKGPFMRSLFVFSLLVVPVAACSVELSSPSEARPADGGSAASASSSGTTQNPPPNLPPSGDGGTEQPAVASPAFEIRVEGVRPLGNVRITTVWLNVVPAGSISASKTFSIGASAALPAAVPASVSVPASLPPVEARSVGADGSYTSVGRVFAFVDTNGNGVFDTTDAASATAFAEPIVGYVGGSTALADCYGALFMTS